MTTGKIATSTLWQLSSQAVTMVLGILSVKLVTMGLSQRMVGNYQTVYAYLQIFGILADFGLYAVSVRELARAKDPLATLGSLFVLRACITILSLAIAIIIAFLLPSFANTPLPFGIAIAAFIPFFTLLAGMLRTLFQVEYRMHYVFIAEVIGKAFPVFFIALCVYFGIRQSDGLESYYGFLVFGGMGSFLLFLLSLWFAKGLLPVCPWFDRVEFIRLLKLSAPFGFAFLMTTIYRQADVTLIAILRPQDYEIQNAYYGTVLRIAEVGFLLPTFVLNSVLPVLHDRGGKEGEVQSELLSTVLLFLLTIGSTVALSSYFWAKPLVLLLTQESYLSSIVHFGSDTALQLLSFPIFLSMIISFCFYILLHKHAWKLLLLFTSFAAILSVTLNILLIPSLGFIGAAITSIVVHLLFAISLSALTGQFTNIRLRFTKLVSWFAYSLTIGILLWISASYLVNSALTLAASILLAVTSIVIGRLFGVLPKF